ncbi:hypothetical protein D3C78_969160 [compost metagenome]
MNRIDSEHVGSHVIHLLEPAQVIIFRQRKFPRKMTRYCSAQIDTLHKYFLPDAIAFIFHNPVTGGLKLNFSATGTCKAGN